MNDLLLILSGYVFGSIPFGLLIGRLFGIRDIRKVGSGNIGATNVWRAAGPAAGILVLVFDIAKGASAVMLVSLVEPSFLGKEYLRIICGLAAIFGHIFPVFLFFKGGKGVNTTLGVMLTLLPVESLIAVIAFIVTVAISKYISLGSMLAAGVFSLMIIIEYILNWNNVNAIYIPISVLLVILIILAHRSNIKRLIEGSENRFSIHPGRASEVKNHV
jgi:glycerol-3-phosphate acyltransferase PlsY